MSQPIVRYEVRLFGPWASYTSAEPIFTTAKVVNSLSHKFEHLHFGALENQNQMFPLANCSFLGPARGSLQVPAGETPLGARHGNAAWHYPAGLRKAPAGRDPDSGLAPRPWVLCEFASTFGSACSTIERGSVGGSRLAAPVEAPPCAPGGHANNPNACSREHITAART